MDAWQLLRGRVSCPKVKAPGPNEGQLEKLLGAALSAPDHGQLRPWRFMVLQGEGLARLGDIFVAATVAHDSTLDESARKRVHDKALRAPMIIVVVAEVTPGHKVPVEEQVMATTCAAEHIMLAAQALGLGAMWRTGDMARSTQVKQALGFADKDEIVAFIYLGTPDGEQRVRLTQDVAPFLRTLP